MGTKQAAEAREHLGAGRQALERGEVAEAGVVFWDALAKAMSVGDLTEAHDVVAELAFALNNYGFQDLALIAMRHTLALDDQQGDAKARANDLITYAAIHDRLGNVAEAEALYRSLIEMFVKQGAFANAASASTNLGGLLAQQDYNTEARQRLEASLAYLEKEARPRTEQITRILLLQVLNLDSASAHEIIAIAEGLLKFRAQMEPAEFALVERVIGEAIERAPEHERESLHGQARKKLALLLGTRPPGPGTT